VRLVGVLVALYSRWLLAPLKGLTNAAVRIAREGDLAQQIAVGSTDEVGQLASAFVSMVERLRELPVAMQAAVRDLANASAEIYSTAQEQEAAAQQQSAAVEEVSRTMQSLLESAKYISDSAQGVLTNAERSKETSDLTAGKIGELNAHTGRMGEILDVIREIANRTDLLALNASLEGTRAGEAGKGFSLVASEMRRLAERVMASVQDVKALVTDVRASGTSTVLVTEEARKLAEATTGTARQIAQISQQQRTATEQVTSGMREASSGLTQSVAAARQTRAAAEHLNTQAAKLKQLVGGVRVDSAGGA
jgi:methyl-accepting chemotaxis protein